jgi:hypothetical protein
MSGGVSLGMSSTEQLASQEIVEPQNYWETSPLIRFGAFFEFKFSDGMFEDDYETITPMTPDDARKWLEEAGANEIKFTLRLPESLRNKLAARAEESGQ